MENAEHEIWRAISGTLTITGGTKIYDQSIIINAFLSDVVFENSLIENITFTAISIQSITSTLTMNGMTINNLSNPEDVDFILALLGSHFVVNNLTYSLSDSELFNVRSSTVEISDITFNNILNAGQLAEVSDCDNTTIDGIKSVNSTVSKQYLFTFSELRNSTISQLQVNNSESVVMLVDLSTETRLENVEIRNCTEGIEIRSSSIDSFRGSNLTNNGGESLLLAGAIKIIDSLVNMINNTFNSNTAVTGGAIYFTCSSLTLCGLTISDTVFENNQATEKGGAIYYDYLRPDLQSSIVFTSNTAQYGPDIASYAVKITFEQEPDAPLRIEEVGSGISIPEALRFAVRDYDNQIMNLDNQDQVTMSAVDNSTT